MQIYKTFFNMLHFATNYFQGVKKALFTVLSWWVLNKFIEHLNYSYS
jgi:hypothetical protein